MGCCNFWLQLYYLRWRLRTRGWRCDSLKFQNRQSDNLVYIQHKRLQEKYMAASVFDLNQCTLQWCALCSRQRCCVLAIARRSFPTCTTPTSPIWLASSDIKIGIWISSDCQFLTTFSNCSVCVCFTVHHWLHWFISRRSVYLTSSSAIPSANYCRRASDWQIPLTSPI